MLYSSVTYVVLQYARFRHNAMRNVRIGLSPDTGIWNLFAIRLGSFCRTFGLRRWILAGNRDFFLGGKVYALIMCPDSKAKIVYYPTMKQDIKNRCKSNIFDQQHSGGVYAEKHKGEDEPSHAMLA